MRYALKEVTTTQGSAERTESAEVIVVERRRTKSVGVFSITEKGGMTNYDRKH